MTHPASIGRFKVLGVLGKGAMGVVYRGLDESLDRQVALKVMAGQGADADARMRFKREAQAAARLQHPNIVTIYELGEHQGSLFMALELLDGLDLQRAIAGGLRPDPKVTLPVVLQLLAGLGHAHEHGIVHRDVKPSNLFLPRNRPAKIMDFGVARLAGGMTTAGMIIGTPNYMSPEQVQAAGGVDGRSDLFSSGLILYELVTGEKAFQADSLVALMYKIAHEDPDLSLIPRGAEWKTLRGVIERSLQHEPDERYADAASMAGDLARALKELGGTADWATASDAGLLSRAPRTRPVELGTAPAAATQAAPPMSLGAAEDEAPAETVFLGTAPQQAPSPTISLGTQAPRPRQEPAQQPRPAATSAPAAIAGPTPTRSPLALAAALGIAAMLILGVTLFSLRKPAPAVTSPPGVVEPTAPPAAPVPAPALGPSAAPGSLPSPRPVAGQANASPVAPAGPTPVPVASRRGSGADEAPPEPVPANARVEHAESLLAAGRFAAALAEARAILKREPGNDEAQQVAEEAEASLLVETSIRKARQALAKGDKDAAVEELKKGLAVNSNEARLLALWREATQ